MSVVDRHLPPPNGATTEAPRSRRRRLGGRVSREHWVALVAGLVAFVFVFAALRDRRETVMVAVAREPIPVAARVTPAMVREVELPADSPVLSSLVRFDDLSGGQWVTTRPVAEGEPFTDQALAGDVPADGLRAMSLPVPREHAAGGDLEAGDRVDVLGMAGGGQVDYVAAGVEVLATSTEQSGTAGTRPTGFAVTVAVDGTEARLLARALAAGDLQVVRSTGAAPIAVGPVIGQGGG